MGRFSEDFKFLDNIFKHEKEIGCSKWLEIIAETYVAAKNKNLAIYEVAHRRFRKKFISVPAFQCSSAQQNIIACLGFFSNLRKNL